MKLTELTVRNFIGAREISLAPRTPLVLLAGDNEAGKSSVFEAVNLAATGEMARVKLKREFGEVVSDGAKEGAIFLRMQGPDGEPRKASYEVPTGKWAESQELTHPAVRYCLQPGAFAALDVADRRRFLVRLTGVSADVEAVVRRMEQRGIPKSVIEALAPTLRTRGAGMDAACKEAKAAARENKGAWGEVTGEKWGKRKGETWTVGDVEYDAGAHQKARARVTSLRAERDETQQAIGRIESDLAFCEGQRERRKKIPGLKADLAKHDKAVDDAQAQYDSAQAALSEAIVAAGRPEGRGGAVATAAWVLREFAALVDQTDGVAHSSGVRAWDRVPAALELRNAIEQLEAEHPEDAAAEIDDEDDGERRGLEDAVSAADIQLQSCIADRKELERRINTIENEGLIECESSPEQLEQAKAKLAELDEALASAQDEKEMRDKDAATAEAAQQRNQRARELNELVVGYSAAAEALGPDGIHAELVAESLDPVNQKLAEIAGLAGWPAVTIDAEMTIRAGGRRFGLLAESGQWRANAMLSVMIAAMSGSRFVMLDRVDVNSVQHRVKLLTWLDKCANGADLLDGALLMGTFKQQPTGLPPSYTAAWLEGGKADVS